MIEVQVTVRAATGLHARPATLVVQEAKRFQSAIRLRHGEKEAAAGSIIGLLGLGVKPGTEVTITADGPDEVDAAQALATLIAGLE